jgi:hypothetical protein
MLHGTEMWKEMPGFHGRVTIGRRVRLCNFAVLLGMGEAAEAEANLNGIDSGIGSGKAGIGDVHEPNLGAPVIFGPQKVRPDRAAGGEIHARRSRRHLVVGEQRAAADVEVRRDIVVLDEIPF